MEIDVVPKVKRLGYEADHLPYSRSQAKNDRNYSSTSHVLSERADRHCLPSTTTNPTRSVSATLLTSHLSHVWHVSTHLNHYICLIKSGNWLTGRISTARTVSSVRYVGVLLTQRRSCKCVGQEGIRGSGCTAPLLNLGIRWRWGICFRRPPLYRGENSPQCPLNKRLGGTEKLTVHYGKDKNPLPLQESKTRLIGWEPYSLVNMPTDLFQIHLLSF